MKNLRIAIGQVWQEQNTFSPVKTVIDDFKQLGWHSGEEIIEKFSKVNEIGGFLTAAEQEKNINIIPTLRALSWPRGNVKAETYGYLKEQLVSLIKGSKPLDGILISFHGSMVADNEFDVEGDILETIHNEISDTVPIAVSCDLHANITKKMLNHTVFIEGYHTCPHIDLFRTGRVAAETFFKVLNKKVKLYTGFNKLPMITPARRHDSKKGPFKKLFDLIGQVQKQREVLGASLFLVQPWLDVPELGWSVLVYTDSDEKSAQMYADQISEMAWKLKEDFFIKEKTPEQALREAIKMKKGLMVISDSDATTAGAPGDSTVLLKEILKQEIKFPVLLSFIDGETVLKAIDAGIGKTTSFEIGGKMDNLYCSPLKIDAEVKNITDGKFEINGHIGKNLFDMGKVAVLGLGSIDIMVSEKSGPIYEQTVYRNAGLDPKDYRVVIVKSPVGFRYAYESIADRIILVEHPGLSSSNLDLFEFKNIPRPIFPLDDFSTTKKYKDIKNIQ